MCAPASSAAGRRTPPMRSANWRSGPCRRAACCAGCRPACVIGFGGYPSVPTMLAAVSLGLPTADPRAERGARPRQSAAGAARAADRHRLSGDRRACARPTAPAPSKPATRYGRRSLAVARAEYKRAATRRPDRAADPRRQPGRADHERDRAAGAGRAADAAARDAAGQPAGAPGGSRRAPRRLSETSHRRRSCRASSPTCRNGWRGRIWRFAAPAPRPSPSSLRSAGRRC